MDEKDSHWPSLRWPYNVCISEMKFNYQRQPNRFEIFPAQRHDMAGAFLRHAWADGSASSVLTRAARVQSAPSSSATAVQPGKDRYRALTLDCHWSAACQQRLM
jgi:hypothetical protein